MESNHNPTPSLSSSRKRKKCSLLETFAGKRWRDMYPSLIQYERDDDGPGLKVCNGNYHEGSSNFDESVVFPLKPMLQPVVLVQCLDCKKRVKMNAFAAHSERCKRMKKQIASQAERISQPRHVAPLGIPKGSRFHRGSGMIKPERRNVSLYNRWKGERIRHYQSLISQPNVSIPQGVNPFSIHEVEEKVPPLLQQYNPAAMSGSVANAKAAGASKNSLSKKKEAGKTDHARKDSKSKSSTVKGSTRKTSGGKNSVGKGKGSSKAMQKAALQKQHAMQNRVNMQRQPMMSKAAAAAAAAATGKAYGAGMMNGMGKYNASAKSATGKSGRQSQSGRKNSRKDPKEKRPKKTKAETKRKTTKRGPKKTGRGRKGKMDEDPSSGPVTLQLPAAHMSFGNPNGIKTTSLILK